jgi:hypothetical protein
VDYYHTRVGMIGSSERYGEEMRRGEDDEWAVWRGLQSQEK